MLRHQVGQDGSSAMNEVRVSSWNELEDRLFEDSCNSDLGRVCSRLALRGLSDAQYWLETTLVRLGGKFLHVALAFILLFMAFPSSAKGVELLGAGATFPYPLYSKMFYTYWQATGIKINYQAIGSGGGQRQLLKGRTIKHRNSICANHEG